jgi:hypothetical protein
MNDMNVWQVLDVGCSAVQCSAVQCSAVQCSVLAAGCAIRWSALQCIVNWTALCTQFTVCTYCIVFCVEYSYSAAQFCSMLFYVELQCGLYAVRRAAGVQQCSAVQRSGVQHVSSGAYVCSVLKSCVLSLQNCPALRCISH